MTSQKNSNGLVLSELVIVLLVASLITVTVATMLRGTITAGAQAVAMYNTTQKMAANWKHFAATCGAHSDISPPAGSPVSLLATNATAVDVLVKGETAVNAKYKNCYHQSHLQLLTDPIQMTSSGP